MGFFQNYSFEWMIVGVCAVSVVFTALAVSVGAAEKHRRRQKRVAEEIAAHETRGGFGTAAGKSIHQHGAQPVEKGAEQPAIRVTADELLDPPITAGHVSDLNGGRALLMVVGIQKIMPRPAGGLLSRMVWVDEVYQVAASGSNQPIFLLYPSAEYHCLTLSITAPGPLKLFPITGVKGITIRLPNEPTLNLSTKFDTITTRQLDISAVWDTISLVEALKGRREAVNVGVALTFTGIQATHPFEFSMKVKLASAEELTAAEAQMYEVPDEVRSQAPSWAKDHLTGQPVVMKFNVKQEV